MPPGTPLLRMQLWLSPELKVGRLDWTEYEGDMLIASGVVQSAAGHDVGMGTVKLMSFAQAWHAQWIDEERQELAQELDRQPDLFTGP